LHNLLQVNPGAFPHQLQLPVMEALKALDFGEVLPLFQPVPAKYKKARYQRLQLELWAFALVEYRFSEAGNKGRLKAQEDVAAAYGVEANTLRKWERSLREEFGALELFRMVGDAHTYGTLEAKARKKRIPVEFGSSYNDAALAEAGRRYKALIKSQATKAMKKRSGKKAPISFPKM
jgi:transposase-like protein